MTRLISGVLLAFLIGMGAQARADADGVCDRAALVASEASGVPLRVLLALTRVETGRSGAGGLRPWPWTMNIEGRGYWLGTRAEARGLATRTVFGGTKSFDVGCFQINYRWHGKNFRSLDDMFDPTANAEYAAGFLSELYAEFGSWPKAVAAYHSRNPIFSEKYLRRFNQIATNLNAGTIREQIASLPVSGIGAGASLASVSGTTSQVPLNSLWSTN